MVRDAVSNGGIPLGRVDVPYGWMRDNVGGRVRVDDATDGVDGWGRPRGQIQKTHGLRQGIPVCGRHINAAKGRSRLAACDIFLFQSR